MAGKLLVASATRMEIQPLLDGSVLVEETRSAQGRTLVRAKYREKSYMALITGCGVMNSVQALTGYFEHHPPATVLQAGIAGCFAPSGLAVGDLALAVSERYIHSGIESENTAAPSALPFDLLEGLPLSRTGESPVDIPLARSALAVLRTSPDPSLKGTTMTAMITVSTVTATDARAEALYRAFGSGMEAMEGAGAAHAAFLYHAPFLEIRAASNRTGRRDPEAWNIPLAVGNLCRALELLIEKGDLWIPGI